MAILKSRVFHRPLYVHRTSTAHPLRVHYIFTCIFTVSVLTCIFHVKIHVKLETAKIHVIMQWTCSGRAVDVQWTYSGRTVDDGQRGESCMRGTISLLIYMFF
jgi:hypothetical protein